MLDSSIEDAGEAGSREAEICSPERLHAISGIDTCTTSRFWLPTTGCTSEIVEEEAPEVTPPAYRDESNDVYVAVGRKNSSLDALQWALTEIVIPGTSVFLVHIFPPVTVIPTPLGNISRNHVAPAQVEAFMKEEENKREALIRKYINLCNMYEVRAETVVVESDMVAETIVQLLEIGMIKRLVMGTRRSRLRKGNGKAEYVQKNAPNDCQIRIICDGKEVVANADQTPISPVTPSAPPLPPTTTTTTSKDGDDEDEPQDEKSNKQSEYCKCFPSLI
ncbi:U-box domain-containing protein 54-like isoform X2 [Nymphaea colorata]|uniref:U-box domain-containing protein 54-like isoform X2 n=1 Tax=Nymphaea colorata TaxID=210225 RepID=UPI00129DCB6C|nr:U-box domain-containing protein 54-like isoform X2 [Nymphaea colorata]